MLPEKSQQYNIVSWISPSSSLHTQPTTCQGTPKISSKDHQIMCRSCVCVCVCVCVYSNNESHCFPVTFYSLVAYFMEKAMAPHSSTLAWKIPWAEEPGRLQSTGSLRVGHDWATSVWLFTFMHWRRKWQPTPIFLLGESQGQRSLVGCRLWRRTESDTSDLAAAAYFIRKSVQKVKTLKKIFLRKSLHFFFSFYLILNLIHRK